MILMVGSICITSFYSCGDESNDTINKTEWYICEYYEHGANWEKMDPIGDDVYTYIGAYYGCSIGINYIADANGEYYWSDPSSIEGFNSLSNNWNSGMDVKFTFYASSGHLVVESANNNRDDDENMDSVSVCLEHKDQRVVFFQAPANFGTEASVYIWEGGTPILGSWPGEQATYLGDQMFKYVFSDHVTGDESNWMIIWNNNGNGIQTDDLHFTMRGLYTMDGYNCTITSICGEEDKENEDENQETISYYIKHPWNGEDWTWQLMTQEDESYTYMGTWNGIGVNINTSADDSGSAWYPLEEISGADNVAIGNIVTFIFTPNEGVNGSLIISTNENNDENQETVSYYIKHPWNGKDWIWQLMTQEDESYTYMGTWNGIGVNINTSADDNGSAWYPLENIYGTSDATVGSTVTFVFTPDEGVNGSLMISTNADDNNDDNNEDDNNDDNNEEDNNEDNNEDDTEEEVTKPLSPTGVSAKAYSSYIKITWNTASGAERYQVYRSTSAYGSYAPIGSKTSSTYYNDYEASEGTTYYYQVTAINSAGESNKSSYASAKIEQQVSKPSTPTGLRASASSSCIELSWNSVSNADSYIIYRGTSSYNCSYLETVDYTSYTDCNVSEGKTYYYTVSAKNSAGESSKSSAVSAEIKATKLEAPTNVKAYYDSYYGVQITWKDVPLADTYYVYRSKSRNSGFTQIAESDGSVHVDKKLPSGDQYTLYYKIKAHSSYVNKTSDESEVAEVYIDKNPFPPCAPMNVIFTPSTYDFKIKWDNNSGSGCGKPTTQRISFWNQSTGSWTAPKTLSSNSFTLSMSTAQNYADGTSILMFIIEVENTHGCAAMSYTYNSDSNTITTEATRCQD